LSTSARNQSSKVSRGENPVASGVRANLVRATVIAIGGHRRDAAVSLIRLRWYVPPFARAVILFDAELPERGLIVVTSEDRYAA
jgi:hypothetical protein